MRSRWLDVPRLHRALPGASTRVSWLEIFFDLVFVAAFIQLGDGLAAHADSVGFVRFAALCVPFWCIWTAVAFYNNRFDIDDIGQRTLVLLMMLATGAMAVTGPDVFKGHSWAFAVSFAVAQAGVALLHLRAYVQVLSVRPLTRYWGLMFGLSTVLWLISVLLDPPWRYFLWAAALGSIISAPLSRRTQVLDRDNPPDLDNVSYRYGLLTLVVLGASFVNVFDGLADQAAAALPVTHAIVQASGILLIVFSLWWMYFDDVGGSHIREHRYALAIWIYAHMPLLIGITAVSVGMEMVVQVDLALPASVHVRWLLAGSLGLCLLAVAVIDSVTERRQAELSDRARVQVRAFSGLVLLLLAPTGGSMSAGWFLAIIVGMMLMQVVMDMVFTPAVWRPEPDGQAPPTTAELARRGKQQPSALDYARKQRRQQLADTVRKGTPSEMRHDVYFFFMNASWPMVVLSLMSVFLVVNVFFAALYMLQPDSVSNVRPDSFSDAFFFSVQTISTIGYGAMAPQTLYGEVVMTIEAAVGILGVALATGMMFAKVSRPRAAVLFSRNMVLTQRHGVPTLMFRVGNARGNEVVDATISVTIVMDEISPEGHHLRRLLDLHLVRQHTPLFILSWTVMHEIDEHSPLTDLDWRRPEEHIIAVIATLVGHDGTYGQTIYARHGYTPEDIRQRARFVDVVRQYPDGRLMIDYDHFHDIEADDGPNGDGNGDGVDASSKCAEAKASR